MRRGNLGLEEGLVGASGLRFCTLLRKLLPLSPLLAALSWHRGLLRALPSPSSPPAKEPAAVPSLCQAHSGLSSGVQRAAEGHCWSLLLPQL